MEDLKERFRAEMVDRQDFSQGLETCCPQKPGVSALEGEMTQDMSMSNALSQRGTPRQGSFKGSKSPTFQSSLGEITDGLKQVQFDEEAVIEKSRHRFARSPEPTADEDELNDLADESLIEDNSFQRILSSHSDDRQGMKLVHFDASVDGQTPKFHTRLRSPERSEKPAPSEDKAMSISDEEMPQAMQTQDG